MITQHGIVSAQKFLGRGVYAGGLALAVMAFVGGCSGKTRTDVADRPDTEASATPSTAVAESTPQDNRPASGTATNKGTSAAVDPQTEDAQANSEAVANSQSAESSSESAAERVVAAKPAVEASAESPAEEATTPARPDPPEQLGIGDPNPGLEIATWVMGDPVDQPLEGKVHVVEFWATWCGPCLASMPHISKLQTEYADEVTFIGVTRENESTVQGFLDRKQSADKLWKDVITYRLAIDADAWTNRAYMRAAGQSGIPTAFVVGRDGVIEWIGHPARIDKPLEEIVSGTWDREAAIKAYERQQKMKQISSEIASLARQKKWDEALNRLAEFENEVGENVEAAQYRVRLLELAGRSEKASAARKQLVDLAWDNAQMLNAFAWTTATKRGSKDLELALTAAERAAELSEQEDGAILDTVARCYYELGKLDEAIRWQQKAVQASDRPQIRRALQKYLDEQAEAENSDSDSPDNGSDAEGSGASGGESESDAGEPTDPAT